jgi:hypothetical protein
VQAEQKAKLDEKKQERQAKFAGMNLYVKNLADDVDDEDLRNEFSQFGELGLKGHSETRGWFVIHLELLALLQLG